MSTAVVIVGGGFGGLEAALTLRSLAGDAAMITVIDRDGFHSFIPSIHEVSSGKITSRSLQVPLETILAPAGIRFVRDAVTSIDPVNRRVTTSAQALDYDYLVLATGGAVKKAGLEVQGDQCDGIMAELGRMGYRPKRSGG